MEIFLEREIENVKVVKPKHYWFVRTYGGEAFPHYYNENYVGLGLNKVPYRQISTASNKNEKSILSLQKSILSAYPDLKKGEVTRWANQLIAFNHEVQNGDTVIIPTKNSEHLAFGTIVSDVYMVQKPAMIKTKDGSEPLPEKRRRVKWDKVIAKEDLQGDLRSLLASHWGITNGDEHFEAIEGAKESLFVKDNYTYLVIQINQDEEINAFDFKRFLEGLTYYYNEFCKEAGIEPNESLTIKIKVQSKGKAVQKGLVIAGIVGLAGLLVLANDGEISVDLKNMQLKGKSKGVLKSYSDFLDKDLERKMKWAIFQDSMERLKAARNTPTDLSGGKDIGDTIQEIRE